MLLKRHRQPTAEQRDFDAKCRAAILKARPVTEITDPAEQARIAAEVAQQEAARVPLYCLPNQRGGSYCSDPLPNRPKPPEPPPMPSTPPSRLAAAARAASANLADHMGPMKQRDLAERMAAIDPDGRTASDLRPILRAALRPNPALTSLAYPLACAALGLTLRDLSNDREWIAAQPPMHLPTPSSRLPAIIGAYPEDLLLDDHHTPDGPLPSLPLDLPDEDPNLDLTSHITGIHPASTLADTIARTQRTPTFTVTPVLDPALELGRALTHAVEAAVAAAVRSVEARATKAEAAAATATAQAQALAAQVEVLNRRLDRLRDVL